MSLKVAAVSTPADDTASKIDSTLKALAEGSGYSVRKLLNSHMLDLLPEDWPKATRAAACEELIRQCTREITRENHAAAVEAALDLHAEYLLPTLTARLIAFRKRWHKRHPDDPPRIDLSDDERTWGDTRKWWLEGKSRLVSLLNHEIERRNRASQWHEPSSESMNRVEVALRTADRENQVQEPRPPVPRENRLRARLAVVAILAVPIMILSIGAWLLFFGGWHFASVWAYRISSAARCGDIGNRDRDTPEPLWSGPFRAAYKRAGGKAVLGCPRTDDPSGYVHEWAAGWSQDLQGGRDGIARIMALNPQHVIIMAGSYWHDYTDQGNGQPNSDAAQQKGYPTSNPVPCGAARLVLLEKSQEGESPGAMLTDVHGHFIWLPKLMWARYRATGGPFGRLGLPLGQEQSTQTGQLQRFQHGYILVTSGITRTDRQQAGHTEPANPHAIAQLAGCLALTKR